MLNSVIPHELHKSHGGKLRPIVKDHLFWRSIMQEHRTECLNNFGQSGGWHNYDFWPLGVSIDYQKEHVTKERTCKGLHAHISMVHLARPRDAAVIDRLKLLTSFSQSLDVLIEAIPPEIASCYCFHPTDTQMSLMKLLEHSWL